MEIKSITAPSFASYGRCLTGYNLTQITKAMETTPIPEDVVYEPSVKELEAGELKDTLSIDAFGMLPIQFGYCNGHNTSLQALEYHVTSEINIAISDMILLLGKREDITKEETYDTALVEAFFVPAGSMVELYATTLHYAPCQCSAQGFQCVVILPKGTNTALHEDVLNKEHGCLFAVNKWLYAHPEGELKQQAHLGLVGPMIELKEELTNE